MPLTAPFADIEDMLTGAAFALLSNVVVTPATGGEFLAIFRLADIDPLSPPSIVGDYELRYPLADATLVPGDILTLRGQQYRVADDPYRLADGHEAVVPLREVAA
ncbi:hypothetical protein [Thauera chlorobenzoica]|uniref:Uncharacterized protein n=1 Tax=Thauera chlorobenzoica TaxID=96773 RepID=A0A1H5Z7C5_9RHOO|nr:hypothetical protein [Thauera chlorobenzoica]APR05643.1 hypothetical protein Tchl_2820 [Thauera chlorobenzoica]SEG31507.1 hypothetical protein SAMN05216242_14112 [Thauera chlorobenzoica]